MRRVREKVGWEGIIRLLNGLRGGPRGVSASPSHISVSAITRPAVQPATYPKKAIGRLIGDMHVLKMSKRGVSRAL
jgi:hypothetical protein